jgi:hypothetical protein
METFPSMAGVALLLLAAVMLGWLWLARRQPRVTPLPTDWAISARPVFSIDERRVYKLMREALPHHIVLSKLPLVRFCQPSDPNEVRFWYELLGSINVTFAVCSTNGRVLAAIDLDTDRGNSRRVLQIKQSVLGACRVRYLRCPVDNLPSVGELQLLVPSPGARGTGAAAPALDEARDSLANTVASRRAQRSAPWQDPANFQDSFFATDSRADGFANSEFASLPPGALAAAAAARSGFMPSGSVGLNEHGSMAASEAAPHESVGGEVEEGGAVVDDLASPSDLHSRY